MTCRIGDAVLQFVVSKQLDEALPDAGTDELHMRRVRTGQPAYGRCFASHTGTSTAYTQFASRCRWSIASAVHPEHPRLDGTAKFLPGPCTC